MLTRKKRNANSITDTSENKQAKISVAEDDVQIESDEEEKELESFLFGDKNTDPTSDTPENKEDNVLLDTIDEDIETDDEENELETFLFGEQNVETKSHSPEKKDTELILGEVDEENENKNSELELFNVFEDREGEHQTLAYKKHSLESDADDNESDDEEKDLESFVFGDFNKKIYEDDDKVLLDGAHDEDKEEKTELLSFEICTKPSVDFQVENDEVITPIQLGSKKPAWFDPDDQEVSVDIQNKRPLRKLRVAEDEKEVSGAVFQERLRTNFEKVIPAPAWADIKRAEPEGSDEDHEEDKIFKTRKKLLSKPDRLLKGILGIKKLKDLNKTQPSNSTITSFKFHPNAKIAMTTSFGKNLNVYQVDGRDNQKLQSIFLNHFPIYCADFTPQGDKIICTSRRKFYYVYDMIGGSVLKIPEIKGRNEKSLEKFTLSPEGDLIAFLGESGYINLVSTKTSQWIASLKMNGKVNTAAFSPDSSKLYTAGRDGEVYIWDMKSRRCLHRFIDEGSLRSTSISIPPNGQYVALGSSSGVVNVYDDKCFVEKSPAPLKAIMNLTTCISGTAFNSTSEIMACYSSQSRNALKLVHFPSLTTFSNWPVEKQTLGNISCVDFSPKSGYLGIGNEAGKALLFRLSHFPDS